MKKTVVAWSIGIFACLSSSVLYAQLGQTAAQGAKASELNAALAQAASQMNANLPMMVDKETRLDTTFAGPGLTFTYFYTFPGYSSLEIDASVLRSPLSAQVKAYNCGNTKTRVLLDAGVVMNHVYRGKNGVEIIRTIVSKRDCAAQ